MSRPSTSQLAAFSEPHLASDVTLHHLETRPLQRDSAGADPEAGDGSAAAKVSSFDYEAGGGVGTSYKRQSLRDRWQGEAVLAPGACCPALAAASRASPCRRCRHRPAAALVCVQAWRGG